MKLLTKYIIKNHTRLIFMTLAIGICIFIFTNFAFHFFAVFGDFPFADDYFQRSHSIAGRRCFCL